MLVLACGLAAAGLLCTPALMVRAQAPQALAPPLYDLEAQLDVITHVITGTLTLRLAADDPRAGGPLWFHLPPNRFLAEDPRGVRRETTAPTFARSFLSLDLRDALLPEGFSRGGIEILSVQDQAQRAIPFSFESNPGIPLGYSVERGLLRVDVPAAAAGQALMLRFRTALPQRYLEGWANGQVVTQHWYPLLLNQVHGAWERDVFAPQPARYQARISCSQAGWLVLGPGVMRLVGAGEVLELSANGYPARSLPLVFMRGAQVHQAEHNGISILSLYQPEGERIEQLTGRVAVRFLDFMSATYQMTLPTQHVVFIQTEEPTGDLETMGSLVLIPKVYARNAFLLDRVFVANQARAMGRIWFGETAWANEDRQAWLPLGVPGFLALEFFESLYGWDARVHTLVDWLNPRYREQFFEQPVRELIRERQDAPLLISMTGERRGQVSRTILWLKAPLVIRSLSYVVGKERFHAALTEFYQRYRYRASTAADLESLLAGTGLKLRWFFDEWFRGTNTLDYAIRDWREQPSDGGNLVTITVARLGTGRMPVEIEVTDATGQRVTQRWDGIAEQATLSLETSAAVASIELDPREYLVELDRKNNLSRPLFKVRPFFDWSKQSETLITLQGTLGGNAIDGNYAGLGVNVALDEDNQVLMIPIYGEKTQWVNYQLQWSRGHFLLPRLSLQLEQLKLGGSLAQTVAFQYRYATPEWMSLSNGLSLRVESVGAEAQALPDRLIVQQAGQANNIAVSGNAFVHWTAHLDTSLSASLEHSEPAYTSDFSYSLWHLTAGQIYNFNAIHSLGLTLVREGLDGAAPLQKGFLLGGPGVLRGYPRTLDLVSEQLAAARLDYRWVVSRAIYGSGIQTREISLSLFGDVGKGWENDQSPDAVPQRQDLGIGVEVRLNALSFAEFPFRISVAQPVEDRQYTRRQVILLDALVFF